MVKLRLIVMIHDLRRQGFSVSAIARKTGLSRKTVRKYLARGLDAPVYGPRAPRPRNLAPYEAYLRERIEACEGLSGRPIHVVPFQRVSGFLGTSKEDRRRLADSVIRFYDARSKIVHSVSDGASPFRNDAAFVTGFSLARRSLFKLLRDGPPDDWNKLEIVDIETEMSRSSRHSDPRG